MQYITAGGGRVDYITFYCGWRVNKALHCLTEGYKQHGFIKIYLIQLHYNRDEGALHYIILGWDVEQNITLPYSGK